MLLNYFKLSFRLLLRAPLFSFLSIVGLAVGFAVFFVLWQYSEGELKSDQFRKDHDQIYRIGFKSSWTDDNVTWRESIFGLAPHQLEHVIGKYAEILDQTFFFSQHSFANDLTGGHGKDIFLCYVDENGSKSSYIETKVIYAKPNLFHFFSIPLVEGDQKNALQLSGSVALSERTARKYFGTTKVLGRTILLNNDVALKVTGVFQNLPNNTHLNFDVVLSSERIRYGIENSIDGSYRKSSTYFKLPLNTNTRELQQKANLQSKEEIRRMFWGNNLLAKAEIFFQPLKDVVFEGFRFGDFRPKSGNMLRIFSIASQVILVMSWINYISLAIATNNKRIKEIGARKTVGATSADFILQFGIEAVIINVLSLLLAVTMVQLLKTPADIFLHFSIPKWDQIPLQTICVIVIAVVIGVLTTAMYPAIVTLKQHPKNLFGTLHTKTYGGSFVWILTTLQFSAAISLIIWIFSVNLQVNYILNKDIGINKEQVLVVDLPFIQPRNFNLDVDVFLKQLSAFPGVTAKTTSNSVAADQSTDVSLSTKADAAGILVDTNGGVDENFIPFYQIKLLAGRNFIGDNPADKNGILISRQSMLRLGFNEPEEALGAVLKVKTFLSNTDTDTEIIGVFEDYMLRPLLNQGDANFGESRGVALLYKDWLLPRLNPKKISLRLDTESFDHTLAGVEKIYHSMFPGFLFNWYFLDDQIDNLYQSDKTARNQIIFFTALAIGISCLGLFGLIANKAQSKVREIGIRKVLGARIVHIASLLLKTTIRQIVVSIAFGVPVAWYLIKIYFSRFSDRIDLQWWHFILPPAILITILLMTIFSVIWNAIRNNPVESLRCD